MKKQKTALWAAVLLIAMTGCGNKTEQLVESTDVIVEPTGNEENKIPEGGDTREESSGDEMPSQDETPSKENEASPEDSAEKETFEGSVRSINEKDNFVVVSEIITEELEDGSLLAVDSAGEGSDGDNLITVYFTETTGFRIKTVVNGGESSTEREGTFSDIKEKSTLEFEGKMDNKGEEFLADSVIIYEFIYT